MVRWSSALLVALSLALASGGCGDGGSGTGGGSTSATTSGDGGETGDGGAGDGPASSVVVSSVASSSASTGGAPISCLADHATFDGGPCNLLHQDCPDGMHCNFKSAGSGNWTTECEARAGLKNLGAECGEDAECESGLFCVFSVCTPVCCPSTDEPCNGGNCNLTFSVDANDSIRLCTYSKQCIPLTADACPEDTACHFEEPQVATCVPGSGSNVAEGEECAALNDCGNMQQCASSDGVCRYICMLEENSQPPGFGGCLVGQTCETSPEVGFVGLGLCSG